MRIFLTAACFLSLTALADAKTFTLSWTDTSNNETGFVAERKCANEATFTVIGKTAANVATYADTVAENSAVASFTCTYRVAAFNAAGQSGYSNEVTVTVPTVSPSAPAQLKATDAQTESYSPIGERRRKYLS